MYSMDEEKNLVEESESQTTPEAKLLRDGGNSFSEPNSLEMEKKHSLCLTIMVPTIFLHTHTTTIHPPHYLYSKHNL
jgi:hypothetical protein